MAGAGDTVVISGKGVENYFDIMGEKVPYVTDAKIIEEVKDENYRRIESEAIIL